MGREKVYIVLAETFECDACGATLEVSSGQDSSNDHGPLDIRLLDRKLMREVEDEGWMRLSIGVSEATFCAECAKKDVIHVYIGDLATEGQKFMNDDQYVAFKSGVPAQDIFA